MEQSNSFRVGSVTFEQDRSAAKFDLRNAADLISTVPSSRAADRFELRLRHVRAYSDLPDSRNRTRRSRPAGRLAVLLVLPRLVDGLRTDGRVDGVEMTFEMSPS